MITSNKVYVPNYFDLDLFATCLAFPVLSENPFVQLSHGKWSACTGMITYMYFTWPGDIRNEVITLK